MAKTIYFDLISPQRYFHVVAMNVENSYTLDSYWNDCGVEKKNVHEVENSFPNTIIQYSKYSSTIPFHLGDQDYSENNNNLPPYYYDLFSIYNSELKLLIVGFPFRNLGKTIINSLIEKKALLKKASFIRPDLTSLIKNASNSILDTEEFTSEFSLIELILTGETNVSTVILDGDSPLKSALYKDFFSPKISENECKPERGSIQCSLNYNGGDLKTNANVHLDLFGNYKLYIHSTGKNIFTLLFLFRSLISSTFFKHTSINPLIRTIENNAAL